MARRALGWLLLFGVLVVSAPTQAAPRIAGRREIVPGVATFLIKFSKPNVAHVVEIAPTANVRRKIVAAKTGADRLAPTRFFCGDCLVAVNGGFFDPRTELPVAGQWPTALVTILKPSTVGKARGLQWILRGGEAVPFRDSPFTLDAHPRTVAFGDKQGTLWFAAIDGRQPKHSIGMTIPEVVSLARSLGATWAVNLDGGCSTTFVVKGRVKNRPCVDANTYKGQRPVANAFAIFPPSPA